MTDIVIRIDSLSKKFYIGKKQESYKTLRDTLSEAFSNPFRKAVNLLRGRAEGAAGLNQPIWALRDVSFEVKRGEVLGIIGRNGSGKSTLLKILSRITEPTTGEVLIKGRVGTLLEVGTGFHPELTGRENIYLNGAILGMKRTEIKCKFDEIVAFSEVDKFIDTPVKHYSSGMYLRLAFAVAAHLEPEILLVDEVLAVGDASFQKKCINKMREAGNEGKTVLFVSHNMQAITLLCRRAMLLDKGLIINDAPAHSAVSQYLNPGLLPSALQEWTDPSTAPGDDVVRLRSVCVRDDKGKVTDSITINRPMTIEMVYDVIEPGNILIPNCNIYNNDGLHVFTTVEQDHLWKNRPRPAGSYVSKVWIPANILAEGTFFAGTGVAAPQHYEAQHFFVRDSVCFHVIEAGGVNTARGEWIGKMGGIIRPLLKWTTEFRPAQEKIRENYSG